jgi:hypothetical protein
MTSYHVNLEQWAFDNAIHKGTFHSDPDKSEDYNYAGSWMYMYSKDDRDYFKNIKTRKYISVTM